MNRKQKTKLFGIASILVVLAAATTLVLYALKQNINLFYTPTQIAAAHINPDQNMRVGGFVQKRSVQYDPSGKSVSFTITDQHNQIHVNFSGVLPNLFREGQGVVVTGKLVDAHDLEASEVLAKHDEKYVPLPLQKELQTQAERKAA
jgi:cytochrome c-type biogenesis protein CcmE